MKAQELRQHTVDELRKMAQDLRDRLFRLRLKHKIGQLDDRMEIRRLRRDLARVLTVLHEKQRGAS
ncbi:MAG: 50S ribosomal protein L29 [Acidobacteria bacterium]|nr:50S ribosomal protein L29 [Acidobacteriota bacterium]MDW7984361.1 50S ribosomal protein L29 [Acidobacteriota bacterium]